MNIDSNRGRRLRPALSRFSAMLIEEARDLTGLTFEQLDEELNLPCGQSRRYSLHPWEKKNRAPQAAGIQELESRVAKLLKRSAHIVVVENNAKIDVENLDQADSLEGRPCDILNLRNFDAEVFQLGYEGDWPTYRRLKTYSSWLYDNVRIFDLVKWGAHDKWPEMLRLYAWQWGILWDRGLPWLNRESLDASADEPIELFLPKVTEVAMRERVIIGQLNGIFDGREFLSLVEACLLCETFASDIGMGVI